MTVVHKYGGSSVATVDKIKTVAAHICQQYKETGEPIAVVVSAMGDNTDTLLTLARSVCTHKTAKDELDKLLATGEQQSAALLAMALRSHGIDAVSLTARETGIIANSEGRIIRIVGDENLCFKLSRRKVVVVTGFQGIIDGTEEIVTLGRGGSDLTAIALAAKVGARHCEIYTDVDGVYTIDPRIVDNAKRFDKISYSQMIKLAGSGAAVLMDRSVALAQNLGVVIKVLLSPSFGQSTGGSLVTAGSNLDQMENVVGQIGIAVRKASQIKIYDIPNVPGMAHKIFSCFADTNIIDSAQVAGDQTASISLLFSPEDTADVIAGLQSIDWPEMAQIQITNPLDVAQFTLVTSLMLEDPGYLNRVFAAMESQGINVEMYSTSGPAISVAVDQEKISVAASALAKYFQLTD